jgi:hypothetical protein
MIRDLCRRNFDMVKEARRPRNVPYVMALRVLGLSQKEFAALPEEERRQYLDRARGALRFIRKNMKAQAQYDAIAEIASDDELDASTTREQAGVTLSGESDTLETPLKTEAERNDAQDVLSGPLNPTEAQPIKERQAAETAAKAEVERA